jgi:hypothetical protein
VAGETCGDREGGSDGDREGHIRQGNKSKLMLKCKAQDRCQLHSISSLFSMNEINNEITLLKEKCITEL